MWTNKEKISFVETVLKGFPFPEIYIAAGHVDEVSGMATEYLVDGQQRITTLYHYFKGHAQIKLPKNFTSYADLSVDEKKEFLQYDVVVRDLGNLEMDAIKEIFQKINSTGYSLNAMEIDNSRFAGEFKKFGDSITKLDFFDSRSIFSPNDVRRMLDLRYVLVLVSTMLAGYFNDSTKIEEYLELYNDDFAQEKTIRKRLDLIFKFIEKCGFDEKSRVWNKADFFTLCVELDKVYFSKDLSPNVKKVGKALKDFYSELETNTDPKKLNPKSAAYYKAAIQGSNSRSRRIVRGLLIRELLYQPT